MNHQEFEAKSSILSKRGFVQLVAFSIATGCATLLACSSTDFNGSSKPPAAAPVSKSDSATTSNAVVTPEVDAGFSESQEQSASSVEQNEGAEKIEVTTEPAEDGTDKEKKVEEVVFNPASITTGAVTFKLVQWASEMFRIETTMPLTNKNPFPVTVQDFEYQIADKAAPTVTVAKNVVPVNATLAAGETKSISIPIQFDPLLVTTKTYSNKLIKGPVTVPTIFTGTAKVSDVAGKVNDVPYKIEGGVLSNVYIGGGLVR